MNLYQLVAKGESINGYMHTLRSKTVYKSEEEALQHKAKFIENCCDQSHFECLIEDTIKMSISVLELED